MSNFPDLHSKSAQLSQRAQRVLPDGLSRSTIRTLPYTIFAESAAGKYVVDVDGVRRIDFNNNYTSLIHGHAHPEIVAAVQRQLAKGTAYSFCNESELRLAELLCGRVPWLERIRFTNSGTEAVMQAIKAARAHTGRARIAKFANAYHGTYDYAEIGLSNPPLAPGGGDPPSLPYAQATPRGALDDVVVLPFDDAAHAARILEARGSELAAILFDPLGRGIGRNPPSPELLSVLEDARRRDGLLLIADEVVAFRAGPHGCQTQRGITADLSCLGKIIGGGFPVGAVGGRADVMEVFAAGTGMARVPHSGTFNANPITMVAGHAAMELMTSAAFARLNALGARFRAAIAETLALAEVAAEARGEFSFFSIDPPSATTAPEIAARPNAIDLGALGRHFLDHGYFLAGGTHGTLSTPMSEADVGPFCEVLLAGLRRLAQPRHQALP